MRVQELQRQHTASSRTMRKSLTEHVVFRTKSTHGTGPQRGAANYRVEVHSSVMQIRSWGRITFRNLHVDVLVCVDDVAAMPCSPESAQPVRIALARFGTPHRIIQEPPERATHLKRIESMKRVITENGPDGRSRILIDEELRPHQAVWETSVENWLGFEPVEAAHTLDFPEGHVVTRYLEIPPDALMAEYLKAGIPGLDENGFHRTGTLDLLILLAGRLTLELDEGRAELRAGDVVVQRDTRHAWRNPDATPARCIAIVHRPRRDQEMAR